MRPLWLLKVFTKAILRNRVDFFKYLHDELNLNPNAQQREAIHAPEKRILLEACPGSGKTTTLVARLGYLIIHEKYVQLTF